MALNKDLRHAKQFTKHHTERGVPSKKTYRREQDDNEGEKTGHTIWSRVNTSNKYKEEWKYFGII